MPNQTFFKRIQFLQFVPGVHPRLVGTARLANEATSTRSYHHVNEFQSVHVFHDIDSSPHL
jgi:hypothetical protein